MQLTQLQRTANQREVGHLSWVELRRRRYRHFADATQLDVELSWVELCRYKRALSSCFFSFTLTFLSDARQYGKLCTVSCRQVVGLLGTSTCTCSCDQVLVAKIIICCIHVYIWYAYLSRHRKKETQKEKKKERITADLISDSDKMHTSICRISLTFSVMVAVYASCLQMMLLLTLMMMVLILVTSWNVLKNGAVSGSWVSQLRNVQLCISILATRSRVQNPALL